MRIVLLGAPGAGKGTQCQRIIEKYNLEHLSSGDILRRERAEGSELGKKAQGYMDSGALVPDDLIVKMMAGAIGKVADKGFVLDGFPRTVNQAEELDKALNSMNLAIDAVINLSIDDKVVMSRMTGRQSCAQCGAVYHTENMKPKVAGICDRDGADLVQRKDDKPEVVAKRLETYHEQTEPVIGYYQSSGKVIEIDADDSVDSISGKVFDSLCSIA